MTGFDAAVGWPTANNRLQQTVRCVARCRTGALGAAPQEQSSGL